MSEQPQDKQPQQEDQESTSNTSQNTGMAVVATIPILFFVPLLTEHKNDEFVMFHAKQGLVLLLYGVILAIATPILAFIPVLGWLVLLVLQIFGLVCLIMGILNAAQGKRQELPLIGKYGNQFNF